MMASLARRARWRRLVALAAASFVALGQAPSASADWQEELTPKPGNFPPLRPLKAHYRFGWSVFTAADADFDLSRAKGGLSKLVVSARSTGVVRTMWRMNAEHVAIMRTATLRPVSVVQTETYKDEVEKTTLNFTATGVERLRERTPEKEKAKTRTFEYPDIYDLHSAIHFIRSQRLDAGEIYKFVVYAATTPYLAEVRVLGRQKLKIAGRSFPAIKLGLKLAKITDDLMLAAHEKFKQGSAYLSDDADRLVLRAEAEIFIGSVWAELDRIEFPKQ